MYDGPVIDVDVHHTWANLDELRPFLPSAWIEKGEAPIELTRLFAPALVNLAAPGGDNKRMDAHPPNGGPPGSHYETMKNQLFDPLNITHGVLSFDVGFESGAVNPYIAQELCRALNDWSLAQWMELPDDRVRGAVIVGTELPTEAAAEIRRVGPHPRISEVLLVANAMGKPFGHPTYYPIYEAALEVGLPVAVHLGGHLVAKGIGAAGGIPASRLEEFVTNDQPGMHHATSLVTHGVFERFPELRVLLKEHGFAWLPWLMWNLDAQYGRLKRENPLVKTLPSEIFRRHVKMSTQPFDYSPRPHQMRNLLECFEGIEDVLVFATDYPHWDADEPLQLSNRIPKEWHQKLFYDNAAELYGERVTPTAA